MGRKCCVDFLHTIVYNWIQGGSHMKTLGTVILEYRLINKLSQRDFATLCDISHSYINKLEKGVDPRSGKSVEPTLFIIEKIARAMKKSKNELLEEIGYLNNPSNDTKKISNSETDIGNDLEKALNDPKLGLWFKDIQDASPEKQEELKLFWEFIKEKEKDRKPGEKQK